MNLASQLLTDKIITSNLHSRLNGIVVKGMAVFEVVIIFREVVLAIFIYFKTRTNVTHNISCKHLYSWISFCFCSGKLALILTKRVALM